MEDIKEILEKFFGLQSETTVDEKYRKELLFYSPTREPLFSVYFYRTSVNSDDWTLGGFGYDISNLKNEIKSLLED